MRKRKKLNEWCHAATCLRVSLAGKDVLQRFFDITQEDYFTQMEKENPQKVEQIKEQMTSLGCYSESLTIGETIWELHSMTVSALCRHLCVQCVLGLLQVWER